MSCHKHEKDLKADLRRQRLKATPARLHLLDIFKHAKRPLAAADVVAELGADSVNSSTVYRNLEALTDLGLLKKVGLAERQAFYELCDAMSERAHHHHLVCQNCRKVVEVSDCRVIAPGAATLRQAGFSAITDHSLEFFGVCKKCAVSAK